MNTRKLHFKCLKKIEKGCDDQENIVPTIKNSD